jgi:hypothetical protein
MEKRTLDEYFFYQGGKFMIKKEFIKKKNILLLNNTLPKFFLDKDKKKYCFAWIVNCNPSEVIFLRNRNEVVNASMTKKIKPIDHSIFIKNYQNMARIDLIIKDRSLMVGGVSIVLTEIGLEIGKYIGRKEYLGRGIAKTATISLLNFFDKEFISTELYSKTQKKNIINISINEKLGFVLDRELNDGFILMKRG